MSQNIIFILFGFYLGASITAFCGKSYKHWQWWAVVFPGILLAYLSR
jgi:uncharacterized membrane protein YoaK (UPF0700 family)